MIVFCKQETKCQSLDVADPNICCASCEFMLTCNEMCEFFPLTNGIPDVCGYAEILDID